MTDDEATPPEGTPIPERPDFPVQWDDEIEPTLLWSWDDFHSPLPPTTMSMSVGKSSRSGSTQASRETGTYRPGGRSKVVNGYPYRASTAVPLTDEEEAERERSLSSHIETVRANWDENWLPELEADLEDLKSVCYSKLDAAELWQQVEKIIELHNRHWHIHFRVVTPVSAQARRLDRLCGEILGEPDESVASVLLHGKETMTVRSIKNLERLASMARASSEVTEVLESGDSADLKTAALKRSAACGEWLVALETFLHDFGYRCTGFDLSYPTWIEDRTFVYQVLGNLLARDDDTSASPDTREMALDGERDALLSRVREAGRDRPELLERFDIEYETGQKIWPLKEDHSHYIDQASVAMVRIAIAEVGRRLEASSAIESANDIWYVDLDEAKSALTGKKVDGLKELIAGRRSDRERFSKLTPPKNIGTFPPDHDAAGEPAQPPAGQVESSGTLRGTAASTGQATGIARIVLSPDDFHKVNRGDVLVCRSTAPMWTPLFRVISALVSEAGGVLSHPAVVAREFKLPSVVGVAQATTLIKDGQPITVSGTDGLVHLG